MRKSLRYAIAALLAGAAYFCATHDNEAAGAAFAAVACFYVFDKTLRNDG